MSSSVFCQENSLILHQLLVTREEDRQASFVIRYSWEGTSAVIRDRTVRRWAVSQRL